MTALVFDSISDTTSDLDIPPLQPAYRTVPIVSSPSGNYVCGCDETTNSNVTWLADTHTRPPTFKWKHRFETELDDLGLTGVFLPCAVDDAGAVWGSSGDEDGAIVQVPLSDETPVTSFTWTNANGKQFGLSIGYLFALTASDASVRIVLVPGGTVGNDNTLVMYGTKGTPGLTEVDLSTWVMWQAFLDDNDDIWVAGVVPGPSLSDQLHLKRLTNIGGTSPYSTPLSITMPETGRRPFGYFKDGSYIGGWVNGDDAKCHHYFNVNLTAGTATTRDVSANPVYAAKSLHVVDDHASSYSLSPGIPTNPDHFFLWDAADPNSRTFKEVNTDLTDGLVYNLDDWNAFDGPIMDQPTTSLVQAGLYLDGELAFAGSRHWEPTDDDNRGDLFLYYFGEGEDGGEAGDTDESLTLRVWGYSLDGHDFYVLRVGPSATLVYDLTTGQWAEWASPNRDNWRAHVGCNWVGMTETLDDGRSDVVAGDDVTGILWRLDPLAGVDDNTTTGTSEFTRMVVGGIPLDGREVAPCNAVTLSLSLGNPALTGAQITLRTSDDQGHSYINHGSILTTAADYSQVVEWRALGQMKAPGRVFEISDNGAAVRLSAADMR